ncbi:ABC transporter permease [Akkermansia glycaniphila]|uniref:Ftsx-like permease family n=1 Tax=Akkermansia glycaniphila TaxID=1679444 RepID=A0A1C7PDW7_9BACT|nr:ABC transporter permease [Akkermansia glycaniphila]OCA03751.1 hypothetical protein AC781_02965 [Akkermansia glycaniphila]SEH76807.1 ftsx-like permease family [Akkermansia glycaniphila]
MKLVTLFLTCIRALVRNPMRALLTILGIIIGIAAVIAVMEIGQGSKEQITKQIATMGANSLSVMPASVTKGGVNSGGGGRASLFSEDAVALEKECKTVIRATPVVRSSGQIVAGNLNWNPRTIEGGNENYLKMKDWDEMLSGVSFDARDVRLANRVCVIGTTIVKELFPDTDPVGQDLRVRDVVFKVIGVLKSKGSDMMGNDQDDIVILPWTSIRTRLQGGSGTAKITKAGASANSTASSTYSTYPSTSVQFYPGADLQPYTDAPHPLRFRTVDSILLEIADPSRSSETIRELTVVLRARHGLEPGVLDDFRVFDRAAIVSVMTSTSETMMRLLLAVAMISLIVGGVGIMNIMMVSVTERTREIGLRMAVGARPRDIMWQFLLEAVLLCLVGGVLGILFGRGVSELVSMKFNWTTASSTGAMVLSVGVAATIGIIFGWYPAYKASKLDPIDALRHE